MQTINFLRLPFCTIAIIALLSAGCHAQNAYTQACHKQGHQVQCEDLPDAERVAVLCGAYPVDKESKDDFNSNFKNITFAGIKYQTGAGINLLVLSTASGDEVFLRKDFTRIYECENTENCKDITADTNKNRYLDKIFSTLKVKNNLKTTPCKHDIYVYLETPGSKQAVYKNKKLSDIKTDVPETENASTNNISTSQSEKEKDSTKFADYQCSDCVLSRTTNNLTTYSPSAGNPQFDFDKDYLYINGIRYSNKPDVRKGEKFVIEIDSSVYGSTSTIKVTPMADGISSIEVWNNDILEMWDGEKHGCTFDTINKNVKCNPNEWIYLSGTLNVYNPEGNLVGNKIKLKYKNRDFVVGFKSGETTTNIQFVNTPSIEEAAKSYFGPVVVKIYTGKDKSGVLMSISDIFSELYPPNIQKTQSISTRPENIKILHAAINGNMIDIICASDSDIVYSHIPAIEGSPEKKIKANIAELYKHTGNFNERFEKLIEIIKIRNDWKSIFITHANGRLLKIEDEEYHKIETEKAKSKVQKSDITYKVINSNKKECYLAVQEENVFSRVFILRFDKLAGFTECSKIRKTTSGDYCSFIDIKIGTEIMLDEFLTAENDTYYVYETLQSNCNIPPLSNETKEVPW